MSVTVVMVCGLCQSQGRDATRNPLPIVVFTESNIDQTTRWVGGALAHSYLCDIELDEQ